MFFDTHAHYDDKAFDEDRDDLLKNLPEHGVSLVMNAGCDLKSSEISLAMADKYPHVYGAVGIHPCEVKGLPLTETMDQIRALSKHPKAKAIGEIGLDYYWEDNASPEEQKAMLHSQLDLAEEVGLPVIIHNREAYQDCFDAVKTHKVPGVYHCFSGSKEYAKNLLDIGYMMSFTGIITYKNARNVLEVLEYLPLDAMMLETDSPYLSPVPNRGKRNDSRNLLYMAEVIAKIKNISVEECAKQTTENGKRFFHIT